ncbi:flagellar motor protein MotB [Gorillibacterium sp. sgz500922]|uniref:flagellar motor protein MotB n=1 Tax=Gorillibacterium sp. sgz500922 TaxID=3446694 RepID=UPI003F662B42
MARRNKKKHAEHESNERWLVTYSDLITLLLVFFVVMYSMSKVDMDKYSQLAQSLQFTFSKSDSMIAKNGAGGGVLGVINPPNNEADNKQDNKEEDQSGAQTEADKKRKEQELQGLLKIITQYIEDNKLQATVSAVDTDRGIAVTLKDYFLFDLGKAELKSGAYPILDKMASLFPSLHAKISVEGHTDSLPISGGGLYQDNWRLSSERSLSVVRYFEKKGLSRDLFRSVAYADTEPIAKNDTEANRQKNRRVEIVVLR